MENEVNWSERRKGEFWMKDNLSRLSLLNLYFFFSPTLYLPLEKVLDPFQFHLLWWLVWIKTFLVVLFLCLTDYSSVRYQVTNGSPLWMTMWGQVLTFLAQPCKVTFKRTFKSNILQVHSKRHLLESKCVTDMCFGWALLDVCSLLQKEKGYLHSALRSGTITAHLIPNWSWREDIRHGECSWTLTVATAGCLNKCFISYVYGEGGNLHCQEGNYPLPHKHTLTHSQSSECQPSWTIVCLWYTLKPLQTPPSYRCPETDPGLLWTYTEEEHCKTQQPKKMTHTVLMEDWADRQTDCCRADKLLAPGGKQPRTSERVGFCFRDVSVGTGGAQREGRGGQKHLVLPPLCTECWERCRISKWSWGWRGTQPSALHPSVAWSSASGLYIFDMIHPCTSASFSTVIFGLLQTLILWNNNGLFRKKKERKQNMSDFMVQGLYRNSWLHFNMFTFSVPLHLFG